MSKRTIILAVLPEQAGQKVMTYLKSNPDTRDVCSGMALWGTIDNARREIDRVLSEPPEEPNVVNSAITWGTVYG